MAQNIPWGAPLPENREKPSLFDQQPGARQPDGQQPRQYQFPGQAPRQYGQDPRLYGLDPRLQDPRLQDPRLQDPRLQDPRQQDPRQQDPRQQDPRLQDPRQQDPRQMPRRFRIYQIPLDPRQQMPPQQMPPQQMPRQRLPRQRQPRQQMPRQQMPRQQMPRQYGQDPRSDPRLDPRQDPRQSPWGMPPEQEGQQQPRRPRADGLRLQDGIWRDCSADEEVERVILRFDNVKSKPDPLLKGDMQTFHKSITSRGRENISEIGVTRTLFWRPFNTTWIPIWWSTEDACELYSKSVINQGLCPLAPQVPVHVISSWGARSEQEPPPRIPPSPEGQSHFAPSSEL